MEQELGVGVAEATPAWHCQSNVHALEITELVNLVMYSRLNIGFNLIFSTTKHMHAHGSRI